MNATPFQIRLDLLKMSKEMLEQEYHATRESVMTDFQIRAGYAASENCPPPAQPELPKFPSEDEVIAKAKKLKEFVDGK